MEFKISKVQILSALLTDCCCFSDQTQQWLLESMSKHLSQIHLNSSQIFIPENPGVEWSNLVGLKSLDQTPNSLCTFYFYEIDPSLCTFLLLGNKSCKFVVLLHSRKCTWLTFFQTTFPAFPTNQKYICKIQNQSVLNLKSHKALEPCPVKLGRKPNWQHFGMLWWAKENQRFNQIKKILRQITP